MTELDHIASRIDMMGYCRLMTLSPRRAALYLRQSPTQNGEEGIDRQRERTSALARARGWQIVAEYVDLDVSASKTRGQDTGWAAMLSNAAQLDVVISVDLDRLLRSTRDLNTLIDHELMAVTVDGEIDLSTADGEFRATMLAGIARFEVRRKGERQSRANLQRASKGGVPKGTRCRGYNTDGSVNESEAATIKELFSGFVRGETLRSLSRQHNMPPSSIRTILLNPRYAGRRVYKGQVVGEGSWQPLVEPAVFDLVGARLADPRRKTNTSGSTARKYLGSGIYLCGCEDPRPIVTGGSRSDGARYYCRGCNMTRTRQAVDDYVLANLAARLELPDALEALRPTDGPNGRLSALLAEQESITKRLRNLTALAADGTLDADDVRTQAAPLRERQAVLNADLAAVQTSPVLDDLEELQSSLRAGLDDVWESISTDRLRTIVDAFMTVTLHRQQQGKKGFNPDSVEIVFKGKAVTRS